MVLSVSGVVRPLSCFEMQGSKCAEFNAAHASYCFTPIQDELLTQPAQKRWLLPGIKPRP